MSPACRGVGVLCALPISIALLSTLLTVSSADETPNLWKDPVFRKMLVGSFGIDPMVEPELKGDEFTYHDKIAPMLLSDKKEDVEKGLGYLTEVLKDPESSARFDFLLGNLYFTRGKKVEALKSLSAALKKFPSYRTAHQQAGVIYVQLKQADKAIFHLTETIRLGKSDPKVYGMLGAAYTFKEDFLGAENAFRNAMLLDPKQDSWKTALSRVLYAQGRYPEVVSLTSAMIKEKPDDASLWLMQAGAYVSQKDFISAAANYELVDEMGKLPASELDTLARIYVNEGLLNLAADTYLRAFQNNIEGGVDGPLAAAEILMARNGMDAAMRLIEQVRDVAGAEMKDSERNRFYKLEAKISFRQNEPVEAVDMLMRVIENDPLDGEARLLLGGHYQQSAQYDKAMALYDEAMDSKDHEADARVKKAQVLVQLKKYDEAIPLLRAAQEINRRESVQSFLEDLEKHVKNRR
jgi:tetratricopeptide (TPR) repeat protein